MSLEGDGSLLLRVRPGCCSLHRRKGHGRGCRSSPALSKLSSLLSINGEFTPVRWLYEKNSKSYYGLIPRSAPLCGLTIIKLHGGMTALVTAVSPSHHRCAVNSCGRGRPTVLQQGARCHHHLCVSDEKQRLSEGRRLLVVPELLLQRPEGARVFPAQAPIKAVCDTLLGKSHQPKLLPRLSGKMPSTLLLTEPCGLF